MNRHSVTTKRPAKPSRNGAVRKPAPRNANARASARKLPPSNGRNIAAASVIQASASQIGIGQANAVQINGGQANARQGNARQGNAKLARGSSASVSPVAAIGSALRAHKFRVGQTVLYTSSPISRPGASGSYRVVRLLPSDGDDYQYRIKHAGEAFERVAKESQLDLEG